MSSAPLPDDMSSTPFQMTCHPHPSGWHVICTAKKQVLPLWSLRSNQQVNQTISLIYLSFWLISLVPLTTDDMRMTSGVVLHEIGQLRQVSGWRSGWHMSSTSEISPEISLSCHPQVICTSSTGHLHIVCTRLQSPKYFQLNTRATALLKSKIRDSMGPICNVFD